MEGCIFVAFRFRKSVKIAPGVRLNLNKKRTSVSFGGKGFHHTISSTGRRTTTTGLPGTGISYSTTESVHKDHGAVVAFGFCLLLYSGRLPLAIGYGLPISSMPARKLAWESSPLSGLFYWCLPLLAVIPMRVMPHRPHPC